MENSLDDVMPESPSVKSLAFKYGGLLGAIMVIYGLILQFAGLATNQALSYVNYLFIIVAMVLAHSEYKRLGDGLMPYGKALGIATLTAVIGAAISVIFSYIYIKFVDDSLLALMEETQIQSMEEQGLSQEQIDQTLEISSAFMIPEVIFPIAFLAFSFFSFILALIVSAITQKTS
ncbi:MAG: DUF4199 domain-containing protein [Bacteroidota bacterium]